MELSDIFASLAIPVTRLGGVEEQEGSCRILGVFAPWCGVCTKFKPYFLNAHKETSSWEAHIRPDLCWIDGDDEANGFRNEADLRKIGIEYQSFPSFWSKTRGSNKWEPLTDRGLLANVAQLRQYCEKLAAMRKQVEKQASRAPPPDRIDDAATEATTHNPALQNKNDATTTNKYLFVPRFVTTKFAPSTTTL
jgi:hypothetical protein